MRIAHNVIIDGYRSQCVFRMVEQGNDNDLSCLRGEDFQADCAEQEMVRKQVLRDVNQCEYQYESGKNALCAP